MRKNIIFTSYSLYLLVILCFSSTLWSFRWEVATPPPAERQQRSQLKKQRRLARLEQRLEQATGPKQQQRLKRTISQLSGKDALVSGKNWTWSILGFSFTIAGVFVVFAALFSSSVVFAILAPAFIGIGISICIAALIIQKHNPDRFGGSGLALGGVITGSITLLVLLVLSALAFAVLFSLF